MKKVTTKSATRLWNARGYEVAYFARKWGFTKEQALKIIQEVGNDRQKLNAAAVKLAGKVPMMAAVVLAVGLGGCVTVSQKTVDTARTIFDRTCQLEPGAHAIFLTFAPGRVSPKIISLESKAHLGVASVCASDPQNAGEVIQALQKAYSDVVNAKDHAVAMAQADGVAVPAAALPAP